MKPRTLRILVGVLVALVGVYAAAAWLGGGAESAGAGSELSRALAAVDTADLTEVRISGASDTLTLRRQGPAWRVGAHAADSAAVAGLLVSLADLEITELASSNPANHPRLGLAPEEARAVRLSGERWEPVSLLVGSSGPYAGSAYVRLGDAERAWVVRGGLDEAVATGADAWRDRTVAAVDTGRVHALRLRRGTGADATSLELRRSGDGWSAAAAEPSVGTDTVVVAAAVRRILGELSRLRASGFAPDSVGLETADRALTALSAEGDTLADLRLAERSNGAGFWIAGAGGGVVYELGTYRGDRLVPTREEVLGTPRASTENGGEEGG